MSKPFLHPCPICGAKATVEHYAPDGYSMGYGVGCPRYKMEDGIHDRKMYFMNFLTLDRAVKYWNEGVNGCSD